MDHQRKGISSNELKHFELLFCALKSKEYIWIFTCKYGNEIWKKLSLTYEGKNEVKKSWINILLHEYKPLLHVAI